MADPVVSPFVGIALGIPGLLNLTHELLRKWKDFFRSMKASERDGELSSTKFDHLTQRYVSLQKVLFEDGKFPFVKGRVFDHLPADQQNVLACMFRELARLLYVFIKLGQSRDLSVVAPAPPGYSFDITLSPEQLTELFFDDELVPHHANPRLRLSWRDFAWAASNKRHVETFMDQYEAWIKRIRETMEDFWWPLTFFERFSNMQALESDQDFEASGMAAHSRLRKLLLDDSPFRPTLELKNVQDALGNKRDTREPLRKIGYLDNQEVMIEIMPYKVDASGFMPAELRRRFCTIAALLNAQDVDELKVLHCLNWGEVREFDGSISRSSFQLISEFPAGFPTKFTALNELILIRRGSLKPSLDSRLGMCHVLALTLSQCFSIGWRHRSLRPNNIIFFVEDARAATDLDLRDPFLCGFEESRLHDDYSMNSHGDDGIKSNIYRHPERWGTPKAKFNIYHDLYAFGVVMLEIGLWEPAIGVLERNTLKRPISKFEGEDVKTGLLAACRAEIEHKCGSQFRRMIELCLKSEFGIQEGSDNELQTKTQLVFRQEILDRLRDGQVAMAISA